MIPALINSEAGSADDACAALERAGGFHVRRVDPPALRDAVHDAVREGADRILVAGGDGSLCTAARVIAGTSTALAVLPGGTLNHFAADLGIPESLDEAIAVARTGRVTAIDVARVNGIVFLNTSSVGSYVGFVETRERLERYMGYRMASFVAVTRGLMSLRTTRVTVEIDGARKSYLTPLVFIGVGERELKLPTVGRRVHEGRSALHVMVVRRRSGARVLSLALAAATRGIEFVSATPALDAFLVDRCTIDTTRRRIGLDGEVLAVPSPLEFELVREGLQVVVP